MKYTLFFLTVVFVINGYAQEHTITIYLTNENQMEVPGAIISLQKPKQQASEIDLGTYRISNLRPGSYELSVVLEGYQTLHQAFEMPEKDVDLSIKIQSIPEALDEVFIEGNTFEKRKNEAQLNLEIVNQDYIQRNLGGSLMQSLEKLPGIETIAIGSGQSKPMIRGMGFNRIAVIDKGIKHEAQEWGADHGLEIDQFGIGEVEIIKGAASYEFGSDAIAGAINIKPAAPPARHSFGGDINLVGQSNNELFGGSLHLYGRTQKWFADGRVSYQDYADYKIPHNQISVYSYPVQLNHNRVRNTAGRELDFHFSTGYIGLNFKSILFIDNTFSKSGFFANAHGLEPRGIDTEMHDRSRRDILKPNQQVNHFKMISLNEFRLNQHKLALELGYQNNHRKEYSDFVSHGHMPATYPDSLAIPYDLEREFDKNVFSFNLKDELKFDRHELHFGISGEFQHNKISGWSFLVPAYQQHTFGGFVHDKYFISDQLILHAALRYDYSRVNIRPYQDWFLSEPEDGSGMPIFVQRAEETQRNFNSLTGGIGINYNLPHWKLKANIGKSYRVPIAKELAANGVNYHYFSYEKGNPNLDPEESYQLDISAKFERGNWEVEVNPFYNYFPNYIYLNPTPDHDYLYGAGNQIYEYQQSEVDRYGGELKVNYQISSVLNVGVGAEYLYAEQLSGDKKGYTLPFSPPPSALFHLAYEPQKLWIFSEPYISGDFRLTAQQNRIVPPEQKTSGYGVIDLQFGGKLPIGNQKAELNLQITNLFNTSYQVHTSFYRLIGMPERGRNMVVSLKIPFNFLTPKIN